MARRKKLRIPAVIWGHSFAELRQLYEADIRDEKVGILMRLARGLDAKTVAEQTGVRLAGVCKTIRDYNKFGLCRSVPKQGDQALCWPVPEIRRGDQIFLRLWYSGEPAYQILWWLFTKVKSLRQIACETKLTEEKVAEIARQALKNC